ncbi:MAG TPA: F0F1 ATP synthase subunit A, partial [Candidatus Saccharimonadales bacterium]|nr:F0F1 ATP synthase subunit A [Candidatus Saccharimonadales bacterium]
MIGGVFSKFAAESGPTVHIAPNVLFIWHGYPITNSMVFAWICSVLIIILLVTVARRMTIRPKGGVTQLVEAGTEFITGVLENSLGSRKKAVQYTPFFASVFFFIALSNLLGLIPGVGEALTYHGVPVFRAFTADLNGTLATATITLVLVQYYAVRESGAKGHLRHYFAGSLKNPLTYLAGVYEVFGEFIRLFSLALRLFLNVAIGEIIIAVFAYLGKYAAPITSLPFVMLELGVAFLQAYIFVMLSITYLSLAIHHGEGEEEDFDE